VFEKKCEGLAPLRVQATPEESVVWLSSSHEQCVAAGRKDCLGCRVGVAIAGCIQANQRQL